VSPSFFNLYSDVWLELPEYTSRGKETDLASL